MPGFQASRASGTPTDDATQYMGHPVALDTRGFETDYEPPAIAEVDTPKPQVKERVKPVGRYARRGKRT